MKKYYIATIVLFFALLAIPLATFSRGEGIVSEIDNRVLTNFPFGENAQIDEDRGYSGAIEDYISDRIGFRSDMIRLYTKANDDLFGIMVHPTYTYGKDGYVFFRNPGDGPVCGDYQRIYANMVIRIYRYCQERNVPFLFVFQPIKNAVLRDKLDPGVNFNNDWKKEFFQILDENGVPYVDNTDLLIEKTREGEVVFNQKYNAGHWNDLGAFYGVNNMLSALVGDFPALQPNRQDEYTVEQKLRTSLMVSEFPIHEYEPVFTMKGEVEDITDAYSDEVARSSDYRFFRYTVNETQRQKGAPRTLVFQGSYMNNMGYKFLDNRLGEYIAVHDYQNVIRFDYYFNLFRPECVIFEVGEYTFSDRYFDSEAMAVMDLNPVLERFDGLAERRETLKTGQVQAVAGESVTNITVSGLPQDTGYAYAIIDGITYDLRREESVYTLAVRNDAMGEIYVVAIDTAEQTKYVFTP